MNQNKLLSCMLDIGEEMLRCGAEISRVEDTVERIGLAYGMERVDVFTITSSIVVTLRIDAEHTLTQTRRIRSRAVDLERLNRLNALSRDICANLPTADAMIKQLRDILARRAMPVWMMYAASALIAGAFTVFFGGTLADAFVSALIGVLLKKLMIVSIRLRLNSVVSNILISFVGGAAALLALRLGICDNYSKTVIGDIMLLIPGITLTDSLRDMFYGDLISSIQRLSEALLFSAAIAFGFVLARGVIG